MEAAENDIVRRISHRRIKQIVAAGRIGKGATTNHRRHREVMADNQPWTKLHASISPASHQVLVPILVSVAAECWVTRSRQLETESMVTPPAAATVVSPAPFCLISTRELIGKGTEALAGTVSVLAVALFISMSLPLSPITSV